jgi:anti-sigma factor RsiW
MKHLSPDELIDAVEGTLDPALAAHLTRCAACDAEVSRLRAVLGDAKAADVPEPSPLFWDHFSTRVRAAIENEPVPERTWLPVWLRWPVLAPIAALALIVLALTVSVPRPRNTGPSVADAEVTASDDLATAGEQEWAVVAEIVGPVEIDQAHEMGITVTPGDADRIALQLDADEQRELIRLIKEEMDKSGD